MSRVHLLGNVRGIYAALPAAVLAGALLGGCSAGQITQTDTQVAAVNGAQADVGKVALRDVQLVYPQNGNSYPNGADVKISFTAVNNASSDDQLVAVSSPYFGGASIDGNKSIPASTALVAGKDHDGQKAPASVLPMLPPPSAQAGPGKVGTVTITLTGMNQPVLRPGITIPVQFQFAKAGSGTVQVPMGSPYDAS